MLCGLAMPRPAMSNAVPWSTEVRTIGRPSVTLTPGERAHPAGRRVHGEAQRLDRDVALVVEHRDHRVELAAERLDEHRIARHRALERQAPGAELLDHRQDHVDVLAPEQAAFAGMGIERADADPRPLDAEVEHGLMGQLEHPAQPLGRDPPGHLGERHMRRDVADLEPVVGEQHAAARAAGQLGQDLGMAGVGVARGVERLLVDRRGDDRVDLARERQPHGALDRGEGEPAALGAELAGLDRRLGRRRLDHADLGPGRGSGRAGELDREAETRPRCPRCSSRCRRPAGRARPPRRARAAARATSG